MTLSPEKQKHFAELHEQMFQESVRHNRTPIPEELQSPVAWREFCHWKHENYLGLVRKSEPFIERWLESKDETSCLLNEGPSRSAT
jgi:hypothetical protein